jgi:molybdopterin-containing oxidoreductase family membrane subunit
MWLERFIIIVTALHRSFIPAEWDMFYPTFWDWSTFVGTLGLFFALLFLFLRFLPAISIFEMRELVAQTSGDGADGTGGSSPELTDAAS